MPLHIDDGSFAATPRRVQGCDPSICVVTNPADSIEWDHLNVTQFPGKTLRHCVMKAYRPPYSIRRIHFALYQQPPPEYYSISLEQERVSAKRYAVNVTEGRWLQLGAPIGNLPPDFSLVIDGNSQPLEYMRPADNNASTSTMTHRVRILPAEHHPPRLAMAIATEPGMAAGQVTVQNLDIMGFQYSGWSANACPGALTRVQTCFQRHIPPDPPPHENSGGWLVDHGWLAIFGGRYPQAVAIGWSLLRFQAFLHPTKAFSTHRTYTGKAVQCTGTGLVGCKRCPMGNGP